MSGGSGWTGADAWVFSALTGTGPDDAAPLIDVIARADMINHAVLLEAEFTHAVPRLVAAGLAGADPSADRYWRSPAGRALFEQRMAGRGLFGWIEAVPPALDRLGEPAAVAPLALGPGAFDRAVAAYLRRASERRARDGR